MLYSTIINHHQAAHKLWHVSLLSHNYMLQNIISLQIYKIITAIVPFMT